MPRLLAIFFVALVALATWLAIPARAHRENPILKYTMKAISRDLEEVWAPARRPNPGDVLDRSILEAVSRVRTMVVALNLVIQRREVEMLPGGVDELPAERRTEAMAQFVQFLNQSTAKLATAETQLLEEYRKGAAPHTENPLLKYTMKAMARDLEEVWVPVRRDPEDVLDGHILNAVARARTITAAVQIILDRREAEMLPGGLSQLSATERTERLGRFVVALEEIKNKMALAEQRLLDQFRITDSERRRFDGVRESLTGLDIQRVLRDAQGDGNLPDPGSEQRDFRALKDTLTDLERIIVDAHRVFRPQSP